MPNLKDSLIDLFKKAIIVGVIAGLIAWVLSMFLTQVQSDPVMNIVITSFVLIVLVAVVAMLGRKDMLSKVSILNLVVLFAAIAIVGQIVSLLYAPASGFILSVGTALTVNGLLFTFMYIAVAELLLVKLGVKA